MRRLLLRFAIVLASVPALAGPAGATQITAASLQTATTIGHDQAPAPSTDESSPPYVMIALTTVVVAGGCLYLLFRRGSLADRARDDSER